MPPGQGGTRIGRAFPSPDVEDKVQDEALTGPIPCFAPPERPVLMAGFPNSAWRSRSGLPSDGIAAAWLTKPPSGLPAPVAAVFLFSRRRAALGRSTSRVK